MGTSNRGATRVKDNAKKVHAYYFVAQADGGLKLIKVHSNQDTFKAYLTGFKFCSVTPTSRDRHLKWLIAWICVAIVIQHGEAMLGLVFPASQTQK